MAPNFLTILFFGLLHLTKVSYGELWPEPNGIINLLFDSLSWRSIIVAEQ